MTTGFDPLSIKFEPVHDNSNREISGIKEYIRKHSMFADLCRFMHPSFTGLSVVTFGGSVISDDSGNDGNEGAVWNYGSNFGGGSGSPSIHSDSKASGGMFGSYGVVDSAYSTIDGTKSVVDLNSKISLCAGSAGVRCSG